LIARAILACIAVTAVGCGASSPAASASWSGSAGGPCVVTDRPVGVQSLRCFDAINDSLPLDQLVGASTLVGPANLAVVGSFEGTVALAPSITLASGTNSLYVALLGSDLSPAWAARVDAPGDVVALPASCGGLALLTEDVSGDVAAHAKGPYLTRFANGAITVRRALGLGHRHFYGAACDAHGNIFFRLENRTSDSQGFVAKVDPNGNVLWVTKLPRARRIGDRSIVAGLAVDANGGIVTIEGGFGETLETTLTQVDANGRVVQSRPGSFGVVNAIVADDHGSVVMSERLSPDEPTLAFAIARLDRSGAVLWRRVFQPGTGHAFGAPQVAVAPNGDIVLTGRCGWMPDFGDGLHDCRSGGSVVLRLSGDGQRVSSFLVEGPGRESTFARGLSIAADGTIYVAGSVTVRDRDRRRRRGFVLAFR
jgi:hypothetical protein